MVAEQVLLLLVEVVFEPVAKPLELLAVTVAVAVAVEVMGMPHSVQQPML